MIGILLKSGGAALVFLASIGIGFSLSNREKMQMDDLMQLKKALVILKGEIAFTLSPFEEAAINIAGRVSEPVSTLFNTLGSQAAQRIYMSGEDLWTHAFDSIENRSHFDAEDAAAFLSMGKTLGNLDKQMQSNTIDLAIDYINTKTTYLQKKSEKSAPMYRSLGILGGILTTIVLL